MRQHGPVSVNQLNASAANAFVIRRADDDDARAIGDLTVAAYHAGGHLSPGSPYESVLRDVRSRQDRTFVAQDADRILGAVTVIEHGHPMSELAREAEWEIRFLAVRTDSWGRGIARSLVAVAEEHAWAAEARATVLFVIDRNDRALQFYPRLGYIRIPERDWSPMGADSTPVHLLAFAKERPGTP